ncbi:MAG: hybrid sensor histidine kinase/response regulator, partial [Candidatus Acidiferrales bacterium]
LTDLQSQIRNLREQLDRVNRERIQYLQNVSHQLVAPLNAIKWHIENLTEARVGIERGKKVLRSVYSQATLAVHLAKNFSLMSNLEADHNLSALREPLQAVDLCQLLINLADDFQPQGWDKNIQIGVSDKPLEDAPEVLVIKPLVSQVFSNIIENAVKYSKDRSIIEIDGAYLPKSDSVAVNIRNRGIPLRPPDATRIFERGYRTLEAKNLYPAGTGFGLYIAKRIVELHEGTVSASTTPLGQVTFTVTYLFVPWKERRGYVVQKTVLLVDDEQSYLEALDDALTHEGFRVLKARDVAGALEILGRERIDLISIDIMLSPGAGLEGAVTSQNAGVYLCEQVASNYPALHAFCLSVVTDPATIRRVQDLGVRFLRKGETPLRTVLSMMKSRLTGTAYSTQRNKTSH